ncbi:MAG: DEAD/DEAH box helicase, partial [Myxococcales bacterium]
MEAQHRYTPSRLVAKLRDQLTHYIESAYPLSDGALIRARRRLLKEHEDGHLLAQEPFVETTPRYRGHEGGYPSLGLPPHQAAFLDELTRTPRDHGDGPLLYPALYDHQARAFQEYLANDRDLVVATGTGSGKTECFLIPLTASLWHEAYTRPDSFRQRGVRSLILYPMNALVNDQLSRLRVLLGSERLAARFRELGAGRHPLFGMYTGRTPYAGPRESSKDATRIAPLLENYLQMPPRILAVLKEKGRYPAKDLEAFLAAHEAEATTTKTGDSKGKPRVKHHWDRRLRTSPGDRELLTRHEMLRTGPRRAGRGATGAGPGGDAPDVLITNYSMLEYMLMRPFERPLFDQTREWLEQPGNQFLLVLDEAHMYRGAKGAEVAFLVRRLCARLGILGRPDKLRVIATSASLGGQDAETTARHFAADLTGKPPASFAIVFGAREKPSPTAAGETSLAGALAGVDLALLHDAHGEDDPAHGEALRRTLAPLWQELGAPEAPDEATLPATLHRLLSGRPWVNQVLDLTAGEARPLRELAERVFPGHPEAHKATEVLLSLGTLARPSPGEASLLPSRIHMMFRGLAGLYACTNPDCPGAHDAPGSDRAPTRRAPVGKLFVAPRSLCDACGSRVLELASCRSCGVAYLLGYVPPKQLETATFLWGEGEGELDQVHVLPTRPRNEEATEEVILQLATGQLVDARYQGQPGTRSVWIPRVGGKRATRYERCPVCQPQGSQRKTLISDLRTRGEQPFTALIEAQFSEQTPQITERKDLPNQGRKVLVFSDGRQKAARLAPALETSHNEDAFRQVLLLA